MKRGFIAFGLLVAAAFGLTNCAQKESFAPEQQDVVSAPFQLAAEFAADTKTYNDDMSTRWSEGDQIKLSYTFDAGFLGTYTGEIDTPFTTEAADGIFTGDLKFTGKLASLLQYTGRMQFNAVYPYTEDGNVAVPVSTVQNGLNSKAHLAEANCPLYGDVQFETSIRELLNGEVATPKLVLNHAASIVEVSVTNATEDPLVITDVTFGIASTVKASTIVAGGEVLENGETASVYLVVEPFTVNPGEGNLRFWVNGAKKDIVVEEPVTLNAGKIKRMNFVYDGADPDYYVVADVEVEMTAERIVPSVKTLVDFNYLKEWAANLKAQEDIEGILEDVLVNIAAGDLEGAYDVLGGLPGFELQAEPIKGFGRHIAAVTYTVTDFTESYIEQVKNINDVADLLALLNKVESYYKVSGLKDSVLGGLGDLSDYITDFSAVIEEWVPGNDAFSLAVKATIKAALDKIADFSIVDLVEAAVAKPDGYPARILNVLFSKNEFRNTILDYVAGVISELEENYRLDIEAGNELAKQTAIYNAKVTALFEAKVAAQQNAEGNFDQLNQDEVDKLNNSVWGIFKTILDADKTKEVFEELQITAVYDVFQEIAKKIEEVVMYEEGQYVIVSEPTLDEIPVLTPSELAEYIKK